MMLALLLSLLVVAEPTGVSTCCPGVVEVPRLSAVTPENHAAFVASLRNNFQAVAGTIPAAPAAPPKYEVTAEEEFPAYIRQAIKIDTGASVEGPLTAWLLIPKNIENPVPGVVCLHPTYAGGKNMVVGLGDKPNRNYAQELAERGYVTIAPDYPGFGEYKPALYDAGFVSATALGVFNHKRCVDLLQSLPQVNGEHIGAIGHSLGGHNTLFLGLFDDRVKIMATSCGFTRFDHYYAGDLTGWTHQGYMPRIASVYDKDPAKMPWDFPALLAALAPRPVFISAPLRDANFEVTGVRLCVDAAQPVYKAFNASARLEAVYPDCEHDFPEAARLAAYARMDEALR